MIAVVVAVVVVAGGEGTFINLRRNLPVVRDEPPCIF